LNILSKNRRYRRAIGAVIALLAAAWYFSGYEPSGVLLPQRLCPLAVQPSSGILVTGTKVGDHWLSEHVTGPLRFFDLSTGVEVQPQLALSQSDDEQGATIVDTDFSGDRKSLLVVRARNRGEWMQRQYFLTVVDARSHTTRLNRTIPRYPIMHLSPTAAISFDGSLVAWDETQGENPEASSASVVVWNIAEDRECCRLPGHCAPTFSPDGKVLAVRSAQGERSFQLCESATGKVLLSLNLTTDPGRSSIFRTPFQFSPDGKRLLAEVHENIQIFEVASGETLFAAKGWTPKFFANGDVMWVGTESQSSDGNRDGDSAPDLAVFVRDQTGAVRSFPYNLGASTLSGPVSPDPWPTSVDGQFALTFETNGGGWTRSPLSSRLAEWQLPRVLRMNLPRGLGLDIVNYRTGATQRYHIDGASKWHFFPAAGTVLVPRRDGAIDIWTVPPQRTRILVFVTATILAALAGVYFAGPRLRGIWKKR
jgi:WD40 repeat protein